MRPRYSLIVPADSMVLIMLVMLTLGVTIGAILCKVFHG